MGVARREERAGELFQPGEPPGIGVAGRAFGRRRPKHRGHAGRRLAEAPAGGCLVLPKDLRGYAKPRRPLFEGWTRIGLRAAEERPQRLLPFAAAVDEPTVQGPGARRVIPRQIRPEALLDIGEEDLLHAFERGERFLKAVVRVAFGHATPYLEPPASLRRRANFRWINATID